ncbi:hypothetical protein CEXT_262671 [Caerostris extrusa]|uniref:Uncharacterized protein n=1 Tax=Caerostris extrusa TaxID=172846 RepID=A0AAV4QZX9_CAEEX|nr:hypothetical protein CEXT_262671 [Caerostris extrusa]
MCTKRGFTPVLVAEFPVGAEEQERRKERENPLLFIPISGEPALCTCVTASRVRVRHPGNTDYPESFKGIFDHTTTSLPTGPEPLQHTY